MIWHQAFTEKVYGANVEGPSKCQKINYSFKVWFEHFSSIKFLTIYHLMSTIVGIWKKKWFFQIFFYEEVLLQIPPNWCYNSVRNNIFTLFRNSVIHFVIHSFCNSFCCKSTIFILEVGCFCFGKTREGGGGSITFWTFLGWSWTLAGR